MQTSYAFLAAFALSLAMTPLARHMARRVGALSYPNERSVHKIPIPHLGGVAIYVSSVIPVFFFGPIDQTAKLGLVFGGLVILVVGLIDDFITLKPWQKLIGQVLSACAVMVAGVDISFITNPLSGKLTVLGLAAVPLTFFWVISFENLVNLSDGLDGLAAGVTAITAAVIVFASVRAGAYGIPPAAAAVAGSVLGFLPYNFHPASIFMGDAGAMYLGLALAVLSVQGLVKSAVFLSVLAPLLTMIVPISDTAFAIVRRKLSGTPVSSADHDHLHHRLLELGIGQRRAVVSIYLVSLVFGALGLVSGFAPLASSAPIAGIAVLGLFAVAYKAGLLAVTQRRDGRQPDRSTR